MDGGGRPSVGLAERHGGISDLDLNLQLCAEALHFAFDVLEIALGLGHLLEAHGAVHLTVDASLIEQEPMQHVVAVVGVEAGES